MLNPIQIAALFGATAVVAGAFGAHALKNLVEPASIQVWNTAVSYQFYHSLSLLFVGLLSQKNQTNPLLKATVWFFCLGIVGFSGSLYLLSTNELLGIQSFKPILGPITPIGGLFFIVGWLCLLFAAKDKS
jgi:uncharacterized membrane protein YgdD (TMEM256/DUF423 family)